MIFPYATKWEKKGYLEILIKIKKEFKKNKAILDAGCGRGESVHFLGNKFIVGFDIEKSSCWKMQKGHYILCDICLLPFKNRIFDAVLLNNVLEHVKDKKTAISEIKRVSKKTSKFIFLFPTRIMKIYQLFEFFKNFIRVFRGYPKVPWRIHAPNIHKSWTSEFIEFGQWKEFIKSTEFRIIENKTYLKGKMVYLKAIR